MAKRKENEERRYGDHVYRDGRMFVNHKVYDDGRIKLTGFASMKNNLEDDACAIDNLGSFFTTFYLSRSKEFEKRKREFWSDLRREVKLVDPSYSDEELEIDRNGFVTKRPKRAAVAAPEEEPA